MSMTSESPLVSVILPAYNVREHIADAINSVVLQALPSMEIIVVDDGSSDGTAEFVKQSFPDVRLFRKPNGGAASARNHGMREARGTFIAFLDADDVWLPGKLLAQLDYMRDHDQVRLVCGGFSFWHPDESGAFPEPATLHEAVSHAVVDAEQSGWNYHKLLLSNFVWTSTVVIHRSLIDEVGFFDESLRLGQDYDYWLRAARVTEIHVLKGAFALYRKHDGSATMRGTATENFAARVIETALTRWGRTSPNGESVSPEALNERLYSIHHSAGYGCYHNGRMQRAVSEFGACVKLRPLSAKSWLYLALSSVGMLRSRLSKTH
ncbi:glycosyltransferase family 2 protein [Azoarcus taiwanensis]|uniref:Glycosyltransferase n=1 Tax=Azoarcus taiwanensis TaxID=666964 RepID=A0A972F5Y7_9RHOO|nr:glycosyltransferase [Azoarcus taiwanensis]NMG01812.1 glycosyltransferase [Azoarcus taiwanensis]